MKRILGGIAALLAALLLIAAPAGAQDEEPVIGTVESDPATVPEAGEYELTASGSGFIPDTSVLLGACRAPGDTLVPGESSEEEITTAALAIDPLINCDVGAAQSVDVDSDGNFTATTTVTVGDNFFFSAGALDGSQQGAVWVPIVGDAGADGDDTDDGELAVTGASSWLFVLIGSAAIAVGLAAVTASRRYSYQ